MPTPQDLSQLAAILAGNPGAYGPRGPELLEGIQQILGGNDEDGDVARGLYDDIPDWVAERRARPRGRRARPAVPAALPGGDRDEGHGNGKGNGKGNGRDKEGFDLRDLLPGAQGD